MLALGLFPNMPRLRVGRGEGRYMELARVCAGTRKSRASFRRDGEKPVPQSTLVGANARTKFYGNARRDYDPAFSHQADPSGPADGVHFNRATPPTMEGPMANLPGEIAELDSEALQRTNMKRRLFLISVGALFMAATRSAQATSYDSTLAGVKLIAVGVKIVAYDQALRDVLVADASQLKQRLITQIETESKSAGLEPLVVDLSQFLSPPANVLPQSVIKAWIRLDLSRISKASGERMVVGAISIEFTRESNSSMSTAPLTFFVSKNSEAEIRSSASQAAVDHVRSALIAPYLFLNRKPKE